MRHLRPAFTLLELISVVVIASILVAIAIPSFDALRERSSTKALETTAHAVDREVRSLVGFSDGTQGDVDDSITTALDELPETLSVVRDGNQIDFINGDICVRLVVSGTSDRGAVSSCNTVAPTPTPTASSSPTAPGAPRDLAADAGDGSVSLSWVAPTSNGGSALTDYVIEYSTNNGSTWTVYADGAGTTTSETITGLTNGTGYRFRVKAVNAIGTGSASSATNEVTPTAPMALSYLSQTFNGATASQVLSPTLANGTASSFSFSGTLPTGVSFSTTTGAFTGPASWVGGLRSIDGGSTYACGVTLSGSALCWGSNLLSSLGDGTATARSTPITPTGLSSGVADIRAGSLNHTCAITTAGALLCWGRNDQGQVGNSSTTTRTTPVTVIASGVAAVDVNQQHTCAVLTSGGVRCWGLNSSGQLGDGTLTNRSTPTTVPGISDAVAVAVGTDFSCILNSDGAVRCWGANVYGQLGDGTSTQRTSPVTVSGLSSGVASITAVMTHACAVTTSGAAKCWGRNSSSQLGDGTTTNRFTPVDVTGLSSGVSRIVTGAAANSSGNTCAQMDTGSLKCWGYNNRGQLGTGDTTNSTVPVAVTQFGSATAVAMGGNHTCAVSAGGSTRCWGSNDYGQLGNGTVSTLNTSSVPVTGLAGNDGFPAPVTVTATATSGSVATTSVTLRLG